MELETYKRIWRELRSYEDVERLSDELCLDSELLLVLYTEKTVRSVKKDYYRIERDSRHLLRRWKEGHSFTRLAADHGFSPMMMAQILLRERGYTKKEVRSALRDYKEAREERVKKELKEAVDSDMVYSDFGAELQYKRGKEGEARIRDWLNARGLTFKEEAHLKAAGGKTVDFLLDKPIEVCFDTHPEVCRQINWIESKGSFGDMQKVKRDYTKQLEPYVKLWGSGMVVYWFGYLDGMDWWLEARDVKMVGKEFFGDGHAARAAKG